jgi:hypothetical protein
MNTTAMVTQFAKKRKEKKERKKRKKSKIK